MANIFCNTSKDCDEAEDGVVRQCFLNPAFSDESNICDCPMLFGWKGASCDQETSVLWYHRIALFFLMIWSLVIVLLSARTIGLNIYIQGFKFDYLFLTLFFVLLASFDVFLYETVGLAMSIDPDSYQVIEISNGGEPLEIVDVKGFFFQRYLGIVGPLLGTFSLFFLMFSQEKLIEVAYKFESAHADKMRYRRQIILRVFIAVYFPVVFLLILTNELNAATTLVVLINFLCPLIQLIRTWRILASLQRIHKDCTDKQSLELLKTVAKFMKFTGAMTIICIFGITLFSLSSVFAVNNLSEDAVHGEFHFAHFQIDISISFTLLMFTTIAWYVNSVTPGAIVAEQYPRTCWIFQLWDAQNLKLIPGDEQTAAHFNEEN